MYLAGIGVNQIMTRKYSLTQFLILIFLYWFMATTIHEYGHLIALRIMGGEGFIISGALNRVKATPEFYALMTQSMKMFWGVMGGATSATFLIIKRSIESDLEDQVIQTMIILHEAVYMVFETYALGFNYSYMAIGGWVALIVMMAYLVYKILTSELSL